MTPEQKAKAYDEAIKKAESLYKASEPMSGCNVILETLFPELAESEDEKVKNSLINLIKMSNEVGGLALHKWEADEMLAWLEKQGEQKHIDKIEPKFKIGDWIINPKTGNVLQIKNVLLCGNKGNYEFDYSSMPIESVDKHYHLWTLEDAKDGDVLACKDELILFKSYDNKNLCYYCWYNGQTNNFFPKDTHTSRPRLDIIVPATKEQRDLLFRKINEEGYEWDVKNQVMTKIEQKSIDSYCQENCKGFQETGKCFADGECKAKREGEQELTDLNEFINELSKQFPDISFAKLSRIVVRVAKWAKSNQPKQEWSEEDEEMLNSTISFVEHSAFTTIGKGKNNVIAWLKSLRSQNRWKPSDEQKVCDWYFRNFPKKVKRLNHLVNLNKLKEEES